MQLNRSELVRGALKVGIDISQLRGCIIPAYQSRFDYRPPTNPDTQYVLSSDGQLAIIKGTSGGIASGPDGSVVFGVKQGAIEVRASSGDVATVQAGELAIASDQGLEVKPIQGASFRIIKTAPNQYQFNSWDGTTLIVDGKPVKSGSRVWNPRSVLVRGLFLDETIKLNDPRPLR